MLFALIFPCYLTTFSGKKRLSGKVICAFSWPAYRSSPVLQYAPLKSDMIQELCQRGISFLSPGEASSQVGGSYANAAF
jgi:hypothetical protein